MSILELVNVFTPDRIFRIYLSAAYSLCKNNVLKGFSNSIYIAQLDLSMSITVVWNVTYTKRNLNCALWSRHGRLTAYVMLLDAWNERLINLKRLLIWWRFLKCNQEKLENTEKVVKGYWRKEIAAKPTRSHRKFRDKNKTNCRKS